MSLQILQTLKWQKRNVINKMPDNISDEIEK